MGSEGFFAILQMKISILLFSNDHSKKKFLTLNEIELGVSDLGIWN